MSEALKTFRALHHGSDVLRLVNCWDAGSARLFESLGARAIATTSAGLAWSNGYRDGGGTPVSVLSSAVRSIARVLRVPLTVDIEDGYSDDPDAVAALVRTLVDAGAVGVNLEDGAGAPELLARKIERVKSAVSRAGADVFVNARTDTYLRALVAEPARKDETISRARTYRSAGADGLFVPKVVDAADVRAIASAVELPLNVLAWPKLPDARSLQALGVRRLSSGSSLAQVAYGRAKAAAARFLAEGISDGLAEGGIPYAELDAMFSEA